MLYPPLSSRIQLKFVKTVQKNFLSKIFCKRVATSFILEEFRRNFLFYLKTRRKNHEK